MVIRTHILEQLLLLVLFHIPRNDLQRFDSPNYYQSIENSTLPFDSHMRCVCEGECERIQEQDCVWGLTLDFCGCCLLCSRGDGEPCGGALGTCARGLKCSRHIGREEASCSQTVQVESCVNPSSQFGCSYHGGNCHCENHTMCPDTEMFLFDTEQACRSRIAFLNARNDDKSVLTSKSHRTEDDCSRVRCPKIKNCPPDSYRLPTNIRPDTNDCCPMVEKCQCNPSQLCPKPECPSGWTEELIVNATGEPGNCCPLLQCSPGSLPDEKKLCLYEGTTYSPGELWTHDEDCTECKCSIDGVVTCQRIKCDMPVECGLARAPPNSCCPLCVGCVTGSGKVYNNSEVWEEDDCTLCECDEGRVKCHAAMCGTQCEHPVYIPGECCPRCKDEPAPKPAAITEGSVGRLRSQKPTCFVQDDKVGVVIKYEGDEWKDGCRFCICKSGMEMCTLITCSPPYCEHPVFFLGDCCPRCPDEEIIPRRSNGNVSECPVSKSHGNFWNLSPCLRCTCHHGLTLCSHPTCPPAPCEAPRSIGSSEDNLCCSQCPPHSGEEGIDEEKIGADGLLRSSGGGGGGGGHVNNKNSITKSWKGKDEKRNCFSDDSHTEYSHGDTWKVSPCQSCVCEDGKIQCFSSSGNCPGLTCEQPILAKNQCCPVCLDDGEKAKTGTNCTMSGSNETWTHGHSWTLDKCTQCICNAPLVQCTRIVCSISCKEPLLYLQNECCPICPNDDDDTTPGDNSRFVFFGGPYCLVVIAVLLFTSSALAYYVLRYHRRRKRRTGDKTAEAPVTNNPTIDCCYFNKDKNYEDSRFPRSDSCATQEKLIV